MSTKQVLHRIKRRLGKERARYERFGQDKTAPESARARAFSEANMLSLAMGFLDDELRKLKESSQ